MYLVVYGLRNVGLTAHLTALLDQAATGGLWSATLATLIWMHLLARKNIVIGWGYYFRVGVVLTLPVLFVTLVALVLRLPVVV